MSQEPWARARNVLCVRLDTIGDVLMTGPALRALKQSGDERRVTLLTSPAGGEVAALMPEVDETIVYEAPWMKASRSRADARLDLEMVERLRDRRFEAAAIFAVHSQSPLPAALVCLLAEVPLRLAHCRENPYRLLTDWVPEREPGELLRHEVRRQLDLVAEVGARSDDVRLRIELPAEAEERVEALLDEAGVEVGLAWLVAHPGSTAPSRRYPPEHFARACRSLAHDHGVQVVFSGDAGEWALVEEVRARMDAPSVSLAGRLDVAGLAALLAAAPVLVAGNTGPVHLAAAVGTPVVDLYALTNPQHTPWGVPSVVLFNDVPCRWCYKSVCPEGHHLCLRGVEPDAVVDAALELLHDPEGGTAASPFGALELG
ncbi:MAG: glycosyltransferase family 9 protein [Thermoleophilaceae bacterium]|nr:glycosyltransferase family 9 protein [Thermoleophilaceae bacterium]